MFLISLHTTSRYLPMTFADLSYASGWKVVLTPQVPTITCNSLPPILSDLFDSIKSFPEHCKHAAKLDWAVHPGGLTILTGLGQVLGITPQHMRASYYTYVQHGNSSSATIYSVLDRLRTKEMDAEASPNGPAEHIVACAFGPGIAIEVCALRRNMKRCFDRSCQI